MTEREAIAFDAWWRGLTRQGDPLRRPNLVREAFRAGYTIARAECAGDEDQQRRTKQAEFGFVSV